MARYGRYVSKGDTDYGQIAINQIRASVYEKFPENGWVTKIGFWGGGVIGDGNPTAVLAMYGTENLNPSTLMGNTAVFTVSAKQSYGGDGTAYVQNVANTTGSPSKSAIKVHAGYNYAIAIHGRTRKLGHAMVQASRINASNEQFYNRSGVSTIPNPMGYTSASNEGWLSAWVEYTANRTPSAGMSSPSGLQTTTTPRFKGTFSDADSVYGDQMSRLRIQVVRVSNNAVVWDSGSLAATATEKTNNTFDRAYGGTAIVAGQDYKWRCQVADEFGTWSAWTSYMYFSVNAGGYLDSATTPSGKQNTLQPTPFNAVWRHASSLTMDRYRIRLMQGSTVLRTSGELTASVANGGAVNAAWGTVFGSYALQWGVNDLGWQIQGRDTGGLWSPWTSTRTFYTNSAPTVPTNLSPSNSLASPSRPVLTCKASDANGDTVTVKARIKDAVGTAIATRTMALNGSTYQYQTTASDLATWGTFRWDAYSYDGYLYSGATTSESSATKSSEATFIFADTPKVVLTSPIADANYDGSVTVAWNLIPDQKDIRFTFYREDDSVMSQVGWVASTATSRTFQAAEIGWHNGGIYKISVEVRDTNGLIGMSEVIPFGIVYDAPEPVTNLIASPEFQQQDMVPSSIRLTWDPTENEDFVEYLVERYRTGDSESAITLATLRSPLDVIYIDTLPESDVNFTYAVSVVTQQGLDTTISEPVTAQGGVSLEHVILQDVRNVENRSLLRLDSERGFDHVDDLSLELPWGAQAPVAIYGTTQYKKFSGTFTLASDEIGTAEDHINALRALWQSRSTICYRDERGRKFFCQVTKFSERDRRVQFYTVSLDLSEVSYTEGVTA